MKNKLIYNFINLYKNKCSFFKKNGAGFTLLNALLNLLFLVKKIKDFSNGFPNEARKTYKVLTKSGSYSTGQFRQRQNYLTGFSLIEVLTSITILLVTISIVSTIFLISAQAQRRILASQELLNSTAHVVEYMSRALRMAKKDLDGTCITAGLNYEISLLRGGVRFINHRDECQEFFLKNGRLKEERGGGVPFFLTPIGLEIVSWNLYLSGECQGDELRPDNLQPRVTFSFKIKGEGPRPELRPEMKIQTTISQRSLDLKR